MNILSLARVSTPSTTIPLLIIRTLLATALVPITAHSHSQVPTRSLDPSDRTADSHARSLNGTPDIDAAALNGLKLDTETQGLIRATEALLSLSRQMKELWLFGGLDTMGRSDVVEQTEGDARRVGEMVEGLVGRGVLFGGKAGGEVGGEGG